MVDVLNGAESEEERENNRATLRDRGERVAARLRYSQAAGSPDSGAPLRHQQLPDVAAIAAWQAEVRRVAELLDPELELEGLREAIDDSGDVAHALKDTRADALLDWVTEALEAKPADSWIKRRLCVMVLDRIIDEAYRLLPRDQAEAVLRSLLPEEVVAGGML